MNKVDGHVVATYTEGGGKTYICDDYILKTEEGKKQVKDDIMRAAWNIVINARKRGINI
ncbi:MULTISPECIES: hypothetical protein [Cellulosilyticum]|uniref:Uncharacterized protein n=1 Tax=Cellulosilyticum lentocellum (strain ATCC 49066 / DSM 5427 / NCIMB 11756 / RHM5) TaxID=642492 RepID=F2JK82_CELLD|nr:MULTISPECIES: hypothetical protein [Cellulosilyticum]ADZ84497.1 hypothetical protein Clole_2798 [Cellulosilyticum lentocellum DSM 5427]